MPENKELKKIKKIYGEDFMHWCRESFPTILEEEGKLYKTLSNLFAENCTSLYEDMLESNCEDYIKNLIYDYVKNETIEKKETDKTPYELLDEAGYNLYECTTQDEILAFRKYYKEDEELCTFRDERLRRCVVFFAVRKDVDKIKREDFQNPQREDEYGTSVLSIQIDKIPPCTLSIKNRYNHTVNNPDATYGNDLDKIIPGLTNSFEKLLIRRGIKLNINNISKFDNELRFYTLCSDGKYYKYNTEINHDYYCPGNIILKNGTNPIKLDNPESQILIDYFIVDLKNKTIKAVDPNIQDSFLDTIGEIESIKMTKDKENGDGQRIITIKQKDHFEPIEIRINKLNQIVEYKNNNVTAIGDNFLANSYNINISNIEMNNLITVGNNFIPFIRNTLSTIYLPKLKSVGDDFMKYNNLFRVDLPELETIGNNFMSSSIFGAIELPKLKKAGNKFLYRNKDITLAKFPKLEEVGDNCLGTSLKLYYLEMPLVRKIGKGFSEFNHTLFEINMPHLEVVGNNFLYSNTNIKQINLPMLTTVGDGFLGLNKKIEKVNMENLQKAGNYFLYSNLKLKSLSLPNLIEVGPSFLSSNEKLSSLYLPKLELAGKNFLYNNTSLRKIVIPNLKEIDYSFLFSNSKMRSFIEAQIEASKKSKPSSKNKLVKSENLGYNGSKAISKLDAKNKLTSEEVRKAKDGIKALKENERSK